MVSLSCPIRLPLTSSTGKKHGQVGHLVKEGRSWHWFGRQFQRHPLNSRLLRCSGVGRTRGGWRGTRPHEGHLQRHQGRRIGRTYCQGSQETESYEQPVSSIGRMVAVRTSLVLPRESLRP